MLPSFLPLPYPTWVPLVYRRSALSLRCVPFTCIPDSLFCCHVPSFSPGVLLKLDLEYRRSQALLTAIKQKASDGLGTGGIDRFGRLKPAKVLGAAVCACRIVCPSVRLPVCLLLQSKSSADGTIFSVYFYGLYSS